MGRKKLIRTPVFPYHITVRANNRDWFYLPIPEVWEVFMSQLVRTKQRDQLKIHAFVLMSNHFHLMVTTPNENLDVAMKYLLRESCRHINRAAERINHLFGGPYKWSLIRDKRHFLHVLKYIYRNPVKAGICDQVQDYPYSSLQENRLRPELEKTVFEDTQLPSVETQFLIDWLNVPYAPDEDDCLRRALKHREFKLLPHRRTRALPNSLNQLPY